MSSINKDGRGNLLVSYLFKSNDSIEQIKEEAELKSIISKVLSSRGYKFVIADDDFIDERLVRD